MSSNSFGFDPYLQYRPEFARSLPIQILIIGIALTLVSVLLINLIFTAQYHYPLAPLNYLLQIAGVASLLVTIVVNLNAVLSETIVQSLQWPYMLSYIAVKTPNPDIWPFSTRASWAVMTAATSGLIQITHIQFLTILYPSVLEARLISSLLVPLSIISVAMQLLLISHHHHIYSIATAVRNVCNATLALLFSASLFIWGLLINRHQAWRLDGGTAAFGAAALALALVSTALNFLYVPREEEYLWLPSLMWAVVLWQSFLGLWWWVGAGSGSALDAKAYVQELILKREKHERRRRAQFERRKETTERAKKAWRGVAGVLTQNGRHIRRISYATPLSPPIPTTPPSPTSPTTTTMGRPPRLLPNFLYEWYRMLRHAHEAAARVQTAERVERIREIELGRALAAPRDPSAPDTFGRRIMFGAAHIRAEEESAIDSESLSSSYAVGRSISWWGPLRRWRLQNQTVYS